MPFFKVTPRALLVHADSPTEAAMAAYRALEDSTPQVFEVVGPDAEVVQLTLAVEEQEEALTIKFGQRVGTARTPSRQGQLS